MFPPELWRIGLSLHVILLLFPTFSFQAATFDRRILTPLTEEEVSRLVSARDPLLNLDPYNPDSHLSKILIPRPPETENNTLVRNYIVSTLQALLWHVELDEFTANTPYGEKRMANIIATKDPSASRRVLLSAHFDSKFFPNYPDNQFVGATDSAMSCALMLDLAETLNPLLDKRKERQEKGGDEDDVAEITLQLVFFDGEEALREWTDQDSVYGARHLAQKWASTYTWANRKRHFMDLQQSQLDTIEHLILLDLLGAASPTMNSYFLDTAWLFDSLMDTERRLGESGLFSYRDETSMAPGKWQSWFVSRYGNENLEDIPDDHIPFLRRGVSVLHLISEPYPDVWHTIKDDASALDLPTMRRWNILFRVFFSEYLHLQPKDFNAARSVVGRVAAEPVRS